MDTLFNGSLIISLMVYTVINRAFFILLLVFLYYVLCIIAYRNINDKIDERTKTKELLEFGVNTENTNSLSNLSI